LQNLIFIATIPFTSAKSTDAVGKAEIRIGISISGEKRFRAKTGYFIPVNRWSEKYHHFWWNDPSFLWWNSNL